MLAKVITDAAGIGDIAFALDAISVLLAVDLS